MMAEIIKFILTKEKTTWLAQVVTHNNQPDVAVIETLSIDCKFDLQKLKQDYPDMCQGMKDKALANWKYMLIRDGIAKKWQPCTMSEVLRIMQSHGD